VNKEEPIKFLRRSALEIFDYALRSLDVSAAVKRTMTLDQDRLVIGNSVIQTTAIPIYAVAIGKAAQAMAKAVDEILGDRLNGGVLSGPPVSLLQVNERWTVFAGGHPLPNRASLDAADSVFALLQQAEQQRALVIFLISGGGSAMLESPQGKQISLEDLREANRQLVHCGASIAEINAVRTAFSRVKGGGLARFAPNTQQITLLVSDTSPGDLQSVASGPTLTPKANGTQAKEVIERYGLTSTLPSTVREAIESFEAPTPLKNSPAYVVLDNQSALDAAHEKAVELGFEVTIADDVSEQSVDEGVRLLVERIESTESRGRVCLISGGEFSCPVRGTCTGGRNLETALRCALLLEERKLPAVMLSAGTDGIDGNSPAAGAIADHTTVARALEAGLDPSELLENSDSFAVFERLGDAIMTGPTGTNVRDLRIVLAQLE
jgi:hydroxypyruvate reductase